MECTICELYDYADSFWKKEICKIFYQMNHIHYVPIRIKEVTQDRLGRCVHTTLGTGKECEMVLISTQGSSNEKIKTVIRHELIHYALSMMNLKNDDADAAFKITCEYLNGDCYKELNEFESKIYDTYKSYVKKAVELCQGNEELSHHIGDVIGIMGSKEITSMDMINEQLGKAKNFIDIIQTLKKVNT